MIEKPIEIRNLESKSDVFFRRAGIKMAERLREIGVDEAYYQAFFCR